jgi:hypothetical protein
MTVGGEASTRDNSWAKDLLEGNVRNLQRSKEDRHGGQMVLRTKPITQSSAGCRSRSLIARRQKHSLEELPPQAVLLAQEPR